jgi:hypothetical protein
VSADMDDNEDGRRKVGRKFRNHPLQWLDPARRAADNKNVVTKGGRRAFGGAHVTSLFANHLVKQITQDNGASLVQNSSAAIAPALIRLAQLRLADPRSETIGFIPLTAAPWIRTVPKTVVRNERELCIFRRCAPHNVGAAFALQMVSAFALPSLVAHLERRNAQSWPARVMSKTWKLTTIRTVKVAENDGTVAQFRARRHEITDSVIASNRTNSACQPINL